MKKRNKRSRAKYPALKKELNLKSREDYIESDYVNGVYDEKGKMVIRPLNEEEKQFLNDFYAETIVTNFLHHPELKRLYNKKKEIINDDTIISLKKEILTLRNDDPKKHKERIEQLKKIIRFTKKQNEDLYEDELKEIEEEMEELRQEVLLYPDKEDHKAFYGANNSRNNCLYNKIKSMSRLTEFEPEDQEIFCSEKDKFYRGSSEDYEEKLINDIERSSYEEEEERLKEVLKLEKSSKS